MSIKIIPLDGVNCIGGNKFIVDDGHYSILLDFGQNFNEESKYLDEFLKPRSALGIKDLLYLSLIPPIKGLYRKDLDIFIDWSKFENHKLYKSSNVIGILLSHAHLDHTGYVTYINMEIPILTSLGTTYICKAMQDTGSDIEICYINEKMLENDVLKADNKNPYYRRRFIILEERKINDLRFWSISPAKKKEILGGELFFSREYELENFKIKAIPVDHSIPYACAFHIDISGLHILYTGDLRMHGLKAHLTKDFINYAKKIKPDILICEGTHPKSNRKTSEEDVYENVLRLIKNNNSLVIADFGPRNIERLISFLRVARETNRKLVLTLKDVYTLIALREIDEEIPDPTNDENIYLYRVPRARSDKKWEEIVYEKMPKDRIIDFKNIKENPEDYILCFSYYDFPNLIDINPSGGVYIYSSCEAFNEEMLIDHRKIENWIALFNFEIYGSLKDREDPYFHSSGHIIGEDLELLIEEVRPRFLIPVHTEPESKEFFERFDGFCKVVFLDKGDVFEI
ncbi:MAG: exonuclease [Dictyoglomus sp. NZ13-RE01]|nr:MAG: exonuclease [Dictyoglomus sp. NZ13-RE01]